MEKPKTLTELRRFMGMVNQLGKFSPNIAQLSKPLRELLSTKRAWVWGQPQEISFKNVKQELTKPVVLALYDPTAEVKICSDASAYGLGSVLFQQLNSQWKAAACASRSMSDTEHRYSQIEKEALALVWSCQKFSNYILGKHIRLETDHKPLIPLLSKANLDSLPPRILRFRLRLSRFDYEISHVPGKLFYTADVISRAPIPSSDVTTIDKNIESFVNVLLSQLPASPDRLKEYQNDPTCSLVITYCKQRWPNQHRVVLYIGRYVTNLPSSTTSFSSVTAFWTQKNFIPRHCRKSTMAIKVSNGVVKECPQLYGGQTCGIIHQILPRLHEDYPYSYSTITSSSSS